MDKEQRNRHTHKVLREIAAVLIVFFLGVYFFQDSKEALRLWTDVAWTLVALLAAIKCIYSAYQLPDRHRRQAWLMFGLGCVSWFIGMLIWDYYELVAAWVTPYPALSDLFFLALVPCFFTGLILYRAHASQTTFTLLEFSQNGIFTACLVIIHLVVFYQEFLTPNVGLSYIVVSMAYPTLYMSLMMQAIVVLWVYKTERYSAPLMMMVLAMAVFAITNSIYVYELLGQHYATGHVLDGAWLLSFACIYYAAELEAASAPAPVEAGVDGTMLRRELKASLIMPSLAIILMLAIVAGYRQNLQLEHINIFLFIGLILAGFLVLREWASGRLQRKLLTDVEEATGQLQQIARVTPVGIFRANDLGACVYVNKAWSEITGLSAAEAEGDGWARTLHDDDRERVAAAWRESVHNHTPFHLEYRFQRPDGRITWVLGQATAEYGLDGSVLGFVGNVTDITARKHAEQEMKNLSSALEQTADSVMITDNQGLVQYVNPSFEQITGYVLSELRGEKSNVLKSGRHDEAFYKHLWDELLKGNVFSEIFINRRKDGSLYYEEKIITPIKDAEGQITHFISTGRDITDRIEVQERFRHMAEHDQLTGLPNRLLYIDRLKQALSYAQWHKRTIAVIFLDIDHFKHINDVLGHEAGDRLICQVAERLKKCLRERDIVARFGGDEFVILLDDVAETNDITALAEKILATMRQPFLLGEATFNVTVSMGISLYPSDGGDTAMLLKNADLAMYRAKDLGRNNFQFYSSEMTARAQQRLMMESMLRTALENQEFLLHYQPQIDASSDRVVGVEALLRWNNPKLGMIGPMEFVPLLEEIGLIVPVGNWVIERACQQLSQWRALGLQDLRMSVNLSGRQFNQPGLAKVVEAALSKHGIPADYFDLEITESMLMHHGGNTEAMLDELKQLGVRLSIDDFGTGYSSLSYLQRLSIDALKVDRAFVKDIPGDPDDVVIVETIINMAKSLRLDIVAEGVESNEQRQFLMSRGCNIMQGYYYSKPAPAEQILAFIQAR